MSHLASRIAFWSVASSLLMALCAAAPSVMVQHVQEAGSAAPIDLILKFEADDGTPLEGKLTLPAKREGRVPIVFYLHGAGPRTYDNPFMYLDDDGQRQIGRYLDFHAGELAKRGIAFFRMSKRGCHALAEPPFMRIEREVFSKATISVMLDDYAKGLRVVREREEIDGDRIALVGSSEGTRIGPLLAKRAPDGIRGVAMVGYANDNARDTITWQMSIGPWRNVQHMVPEAREGEFTRAKYDEVVKANPALGRMLPFEPLDVDGDGVLTADDLMRANRPLLDAILQAVKERNDDLLWTYLLNLSSAYLLEWWEAEPNHVNLLALDVPLAIFHGTLDGTTRVEGVHEAAAAFREAGRANLAVHIYDDADHDVDWTWRAAREGGPPAYRDAFALMAQWLGVGN